MPEAIPSPVCSAVGAEAECLMELRLPARIDRLKLIRACVREAARMSGFASNPAQDVVLAVDEACQNIIVHGYRGRSDGEIVVTLWRTTEGLRVDLRDWAPKVDPAQVRPRALDDVRPGQLGTHFIRTIMDRVTFSAAPDGGNVLELHKRHGKRERYGQQERYGQ